MARSLRDPAPLSRGLDELVLLPIGVLLAVKMIPAEILTEHRERARLAMQRPTSRVGAAMIVTVWLLVATIAAILTVGWLGW